MRKVRVNLRDGSEDPCYAFNQWVYHGRGQGLTDLDVRKVKRECYAAILAVLDQYSVPPASEEAQALLITELKELINDCK